MGNSDTFIFKSTFPCPARNLYDWHSRPGALERLIPPWERTAVLSKHGGIRPGGRAEMRMHLGPFPYRWAARHVEDRPGVMFRDIQEKGPFSSWSHSHFFTDTAAGSLLEDRIAFSLPAHALLPGLVKKQVHRILERVFRYRHATLREDLILHASCSKTPLRILVTGASGVLGRALLPLLTTGGHQVWTLVRHRPALEKNEVYWDPLGGVIDTQNLPPDLDGVIHLAGEYIGLNRWSEEKKRKVVDSRTMGTSLLAKTLGALPVPPKVFLSASAVGYYGENRQQGLDEDTAPGGHFISRICDLWEKSAAPAQDAGIRTVLLRIGVVLTPRGGALRQLLGASPVGIFRSFGKGDQYVSWIGLDDTLGALLHCLANSTLNGPVNIAAPAPVTNREMMQTVARVLGRPLFPPLPAWLLKTLYGQMATEILLSGCHVSTAKLTASGFQFRHPEMEGLLRRQLCREPVTIQEGEK